MFDNEEVPGDDTFDAAAQAAEAASNAIAESARKQMAFVDETLYRQRVHTLALTMATLMRTAYDFPTAQRLALDVVRWAEMKETKP